MSISPDEHLGNRREVLEEPAKMVRRDKKESWKLLPYFTNYSNGNKSNNVPYYLTGMVMIMEMKRQNKIL